MQWNVCKRWWMFDDPRSSGARSILQWAADGLRSRDREVSVYALNPDHPESVPRMRADLEQFQPDCVLLANHPARTFWNRLGYQQAPCPAVVWVFDDPFLMGDEPFGVDERIWVADPGFEAGAVGRGARSVQFVPVAAPVDVGTEPVVEPDYPVVYVGATLRLTSLRDQLPPHMAAYFDRIAEARAHAPEVSFQKLMEQIPYQPGKRIPVTGQVAYYLYTEANRRFRMRWLHPLAAQGVCIYGNTAWREEVQGTPLDGHYFGPVEALTAYPHLLSRSALALNLRSLQGITAPTHRDFLIPCTGSLALATPQWTKDRQADTEDRWGLGSFPWPEAAETPEDMAARVQHWLQCPEERMTTVREQREVIAAQHTMANRFARIAALWDEWEEQR